MPIYEYEGQHYDIDTTDHAVAKSKILSHLGRSSAPPAEERPSLGMPGDDMSAAILAASNLPTTRKTSIFEKGTKLEPPTAPPAAEPRMARPEFVKAIESRFNAMPEEQRTAALAKMAERRDVYGRVARDIARRYEAMSGIESKPIRQAFDPRLEVQTERFMEQGAGLDTAKMLATQDALRGVIGPAAAQARAPTPEEEAAREYQFQRGMTGAEQLALTGRRVGERLQMSIAQQGAGLVRFAGDAFGLDTGDLNRTAANIDSYMQSMGENPSTALNVLENASVSLASQLPFMLTGSQTVALGNMFLQSFGQAYDQARRAGLDKTDSTTKASLDAALEMIGEKLGLKQQIEGLKATARGNVSDAIKHYAKGLAREIPGEQFTYTGQTATGQAFRTDPEKSLEQFLRGAVDTALTTVAQTGMLMGGSAAAAKGIGKFQEAQLERALGRELQSKEFEQEAIDEYARRAMSPEFYSGQTVVPGVRAVAGLPETQGPMPERPEGFTPPTAAEAPPPTPPAPPPPAPAAPAPTAAAPATDIYGRVEPSMGEAPPAGEPEVDRAAEINRLIAAGIDPEDASEMVEKAALARMEAETQDEKLRSRIDALTEEFVAAGVPPKEARARAIEQVQQEEQADEDAAKVAEGEASAARPIGAPSGAGVGVAGEPGAGAPTKRATRAKRTGVVPAEPDVGKPAVGEGAEPGAVTTPPAEAPAPAPIRTTDQIMDEVKGLEAQRMGLLTKAGRVPAVNSPARKKYDALVDQIAALKEKWHEADREERKQKKTAAPATTAPAAPPATAPAAAPTPTAPAKPRGRPKKERTPEEVQGAKDLRRQQTLDANQARRDVTAAMNMLARALAPIPRSAKNKDVLTEEARRNRAEAIRKLYELSRTNKNKPGKDAAEALKNPKLTAEELEQAKTAYEESKQRARPAPRMVVPAQKPAKRRIVTRIPSLKRTVDKLRRLLGEDKISHVEFAAKIAEAVDAVAQAERMKPMRRRTRGADYLIERLARAKRRKELPPETADLAIWFISQNPELATDLGISIRGVKKGEESTGGFYDIVSRVAYIVKNNADAVTAVHEILHHIEQLLPADVRDAILKSWAKALAKAAKGKNSTAEQAYLDKLLDFHFGQPTTANPTQVYNDLIEMITSGEVPLEFYQYLDPSEFWAVNASDILKGRFDAKGDTLARLKNWATEFIEKVKDFFGLASDAPIIRGLESALKTEGKYLGNLLRDEAIGMAMPKQITPADKRTAQELEKEVNTAIENFEASATATDVADNVSLLQSLRDFDKLSAYFKGLYEKLNGARLSSVLFFMTNDTVAQWGSAYVPELANTNKLLRKMRTLGRSLLGGAEQMSSELNRAIKDDPSLRRKLEEITSIATDVRVDPSKGPRPGAEKLTEMYKQLGDKGRALYNKLRDYYADVVAYYEKVLDDQIAQSKMPKAAQNIVMAEIKKLYETDKKIVPYFPFIRNRGDLWLRVGKGRNRQFITFANEMERRAVMEEIAKQHIDSVTGKPYTVEELLGPQVGLFEKGDTLEGFRKATSDLTISLKKIFETIDNSVDPQDVVGRVAQLKNTIAKENPNMSEDDVRKEAYEQARDELTRDLKDAIYELYLMTLPDQNFRTSFIARKDVAGYNVDLLRNFSTYAIRISSQLPRIKYGPLLRNSLRAAEKSLKENPDASKLMRFVNEMERRVDLELNPYAAPSRGVPPALSKAIGKTVDFATRMAFVHYLSAGASAIVQSTGMLYGLSTLGARHGYARTFAEMVKLMKFWNTYGVRQQNNDGSITYRVPSIIHSKTVQASPQLRLAMREMLGAGIGEYTLTSEMLNRGRVSTAAFESRGSRLGRGAMMLVAGPFQTIERLVQESLFFMSYNMSRADGIKKGLEGKELNDYAADQAIADVHDSVGNMAETNRPPIFRNAAGRFLLQFMLFPLFITTRWMREAYRSVTAKGGDAKLQAFKELAGIMGVTWMLAGAAGLPFFSTILGYMGAWLEDEDEKMGRKTFKDLDYWTWWRTVWLPQYMGKIGVFGRPLTEVVGMTDKQLAALFERGPANMITGVDIASRTSISPTDMFSGQNKEVRTTKEGALQFAEDRAGPFVGMVLSYMDAYDAFGDGDIQRGMEKMLPAFAKNPAVAWKYYNEGIKDFRGATILKKDSMTTGRLMYQAIGFRLDEVANQQKFLFALSKVENKIRFEREDILKNLRDSYGKKDFSRYKDWMQKRLEFSRKYPSFAIEDDDVVRSVSSSAERAASAVRGFVPTEQNIPIFREAVVERGKAMREYEERTKK